MADIIFKVESFKIIGLCMEVHNNLGTGFLEVVYKDALEYEFRKAKIHFEREKEYETHLAQSINYLSISNIKLSLIVNFGGLKLEYKRIVR